jgi:GH43 family beta-xylosidase
MKRRDIRIRDPFILYENGVYYMYTSSGERTLSYYRSADLENWEEGGVSFEIPKDFWAYKDVWAGEVHKYKGKYYLFVSLLGRNGLRGTQIAVSDKPDGEFVPLVDRAVTPLDQSCIDGTLFVCDGKPFILYSHDWPDNYVEEKEAYVGEIWCSELEEDLTAMKGDPIRLFASDEVPISKATPHNITWEGRRTKRYGSDAPFVQRLPGGALYLTWSPYLDDHYVVLGAISKSGNIFGPWEHLDTPLFEDDGGHAMFFNDAIGRKIMCIHAPERHMLERAHLYHMAEDENYLKILAEIPI